MVRRWFKALCARIVSEAGLDVRMANQYLRVLSEPQPDRPDLEQIQREYEAELEARDRILTEMRAAINDLDVRLRRADPIVQQLVSQDTRSVSYEMLQAMFERLERQERQIKRLQSEPGAGEARERAYIEAAKAEGPES